MRIIVAIFTALLLTGCGGESHDNAPASPTPPPTTMAHKEAEQPIDVKKMLIDNGWSDDRIIPGALNASYQVYPFVKPYGLVTKKVSPVTCYFNFRRADYQQGRAATDFAFTTREKNANVMLYTHASSGDRVYRAEKQLPVDEITRPKLKELFKDNLEPCGNTDLN